MNTGSIRLTRSHKKLWKNRWSSSFLAREPNCPRVIFRRERKRRPRQRSSGKSQANQGESCRNHSRTSLAGDRVRHRQPGGYRKSQSAVCLAQRGLDEIWRSAPGKNESQIARAFWPCGDEVMKPRRDLDLANTRDRERPLQSFYVFENAAAGHGDHHHSCGVWFPLHVRIGHPQRFTDQQFLQEDSLRAKTKHPRAQAADGARRNFEYPGPLVIQAKLRMQRAFAEPQSLNGFGGTSKDLFLGSGSQPRRREVNRFLEIGSVERIGFVKQG